jgi:hypothetical protein
MTLLHEWETFYVIVGSSSAALIGLQFVVIALVADVRKRASMGEIDAFASPTIVHFGVVLLLAGILTAPWRTPGFPALLLAACGLGTVTYTIVVIRRMLRQKHYRPVFEDWLFHAALPSLAYTLLAWGGLMLRRDPDHALFATGTAALLLMLVGIHNAWDTVTFIVLTGPKNPPPPARQETDKVPVPE